MAVPVHVISGFLGAGKTTLLLDQLQRRAGAERGAVIVNDFGEARFDATLLGGAVSVAEVAGGCVCCTAPHALVPLLTELLASQRPDRVYIETTGLARPADVVDTLGRSGLDVELRPVTVVVDPRRLVGDVPPLLLEQLDAADVVILSHSDRTTREHLAAFQSLTDGHFPAFLQVVQAERGGVDPALFELRRAGGPLHHDHDHDHASTDGFSAASGSWSPERVFDAARLKALIANSDFERVKGLFRTDAGWLRIERAGGELHVVGSPLRACSAVDVIARGGDPEALVRAIDACVAVPRVAAPSLTLVDADGFETTLSREALAGLPGQLDDVSARVPGRVGAAVPLRELLAIAGPGSRFILVAHDGLATAPTPIAGAGEALLVHSLGDGPFPKDQGGPFRVLVPPGADKSACANVKGLARVVLER